MTTNQNNHAYTAQLGPLEDGERLIEATLALAYEQRTANLIALYADGAHGPIPGVDYRALADQITERLGL
jgi:hypothetical protein